MTDDAKALREQLETATGERIAALEAVGAEKAKPREAAPNAPTKSMEAGERAGRSPDRGVESGARMERDGGGQTSKDREPAQSVRKKSAGIDFGL